MSVAKRLGGDRRERREVGWEVLRLLGKGEGDASQKDR